MDIDREDINSTAVENSPERAESPMSVDESDLIDPNSLIAMPDHIIDQIFYSLDDLADRKSLSESCTKFNGIFSDPLYINKFWLDLKQSQLVIKPLRASSRVYENLIWRRNLPVKVLQHLSPNLKCLKIQIRPDNSRYLAVSLAKILPFCGNLTHLEVELSGFKNLKQSLLLFEPNVDFDRIKMKNLEILKIMDTRFFKYLRDHFIDFRSTVKLQTIDLSADKDLEYDEYEIEDLNIDIRVLISAQKHLKTLKLYVDENFFDQKLVVQSKLKKLAFNNDLNFKNLEQAGNFLDFMEIQNELESFEVEDVVFPECNERVKYFKQKRMNMKIESMEISFWKEEDSARHLDSIDKTILMGPPNLTVEKIFMFFNEEVSGYVADNFPMIISKYPNVIFIGLYSSPQDGFQALKDFKNLMALYLNDKSECLELITIPSLKHFEFSLTESMTDDQIKEFFKRHKNIEILAINFSYHLFAGEYDGEMAKKLIKVIDSALQNLKDLKSINLRETEVLKHQTPLINKIITSIAKHAQPGFQLTSFKGLEVFKRDDMRIVRKYEGRWVRMINCKKTNHHSTNLHGKPKF